MLEWLLTIGAAELGKAIFDQVLKLSQSAAEDYVKDFFKDCLKKGITTAKPEVTKKAVAEALKAFLLLVTDELEDQELSKAEIRDRYDPALVQFIKDDSVKPILGKAFEKDCAGVDVTVLATIWQQSKRRNNPFPAMTAEFDWQRVGREYLNKVRRIIRETPELRSLLETELLEEIAKNTSQISPGFDVAKYRESLQCSYGYLKLNAIDSTDRADAIKLWNMFIEQSVRKSLPPMRYDLPLDLKRQLQEQGRLESDLSPEALESYRQDYFQQTPEKVLKAVANSQRAVILGDPGAGKSMLLQYLALEWVEGKTKSLPLLIELREYAIAPVNNFLDFLHRGRGVDWQFDQQQLHQHLKEQLTLVMFDGLDEVFDRSTQAAIVDDIIRFTQEYPKAKILITSRIIGYDPERLQQANFSQFTIQPLSIDEIHKFIDRWYTLALGNDSDKLRLVTRLKEAIKNSKSIQNLADNPLLLTMMAILNRRQELPRDRADLYDQASRVLLYHWDVDHKRLQLPMDAIGRREKQEMLRLIAYEMQAGEEGLKGNLISADQLTRIMTNYLRDQGFGEPREKANRLIDQLRHRNFILCDRGADTYGFVHRTFLEYFCAVEIVNRFEKQRTLTFEHLRDDVFGQHWQDKTWHEVLKLLSGLLGEEIVGDIVDFLSEQESEDFKSLFLSAQCLLEVKNRYKIEQLDSKLLNKLKSVSDYGDIHNFQKGRLKTPEEAKQWRFISTIREESVFAIGSVWSGELTLLPWLKNFVSFSSAHYARQEAVRQIVRGWKDDPETLPWLKEIAQTDQTLSLPLLIVKEIATYWRDDPSIFSWLKNHARSNKNWEIQYAAVQELCRSWKDEPEILLWLKTYDEWDCHPNVKEQAVMGLVSIVKDDPNTLSWLKSEILSHSIWAIRRAAVRLLAEIWRDDSETVFLLKNSAQYDKHNNVRFQSVRELAKGWRTDSMFEFLATLATSDPFNGNREDVITRLIAYYPNHPKIIELLSDRAINDPDKQLRQWAAEQLKMQDVKLATESL